MRTAIRVSIVALALLAGTTVAPPGSRADGNTVQMVDNEPDLTNWHFDPALLTVPAGSTVVWHNRGHEEHSVTADDKSFDSGLKKPGTDFQRVFPKLGKFTYHCQPHPWMTGTIQVVAAATTTTVSTAAAAPPTVPGAANPTAPPSSAAPGSPAASAPAGQGQAGTPGTSTTGASAGSGSSSGAPANGSAAPAGKKSHSRAGLLGTLAIVLLPTLGALAVGARMRRSRS